MTRTMSRAELNRAAVQRVAETIWSHITPEPNTGCWLWTMHLCRDGSARQGVTIAGQRSGRLVPRDMLQSRGVYLPPGVPVMKTCGQSACVNPDHLRLGSMAEVALRVRRMGRSGTAVLTFEAAGEMRRLRERGATVMQLAGRFGVSCTTVKNVLRGRAYRSEEHSLVGPVGGVRVCVPSVPRVSDPTVRLTKEAPMLPESPTPRPPQGITVRHMNTGDPRRDFHPRYRSVRRIDPESLMVRREDPETGKVIEVRDPAMALPVALDSSERRIKRVKPNIAAELLECDGFSGGPSVHRLATDAEVEQMEREAAARAAGRVGASK